MSASSFSSSWPRSRGPLIVHETEEEEVEAGALVAEESIVTDDGNLDEAGELMQIPSFDDEEEDANDSFSTGSLTEDGNNHDLHVESVSSATSTAAQLTMNDSDTDDDSSDDSSIEILEITRVHSFEKLVDVDGLKHLKSPSSPEAKLASTASLPKLQLLNDTYATANASETTDGWIPSKAFNHSTIIPSLSYASTKARGVRFREAAMTDLSIFCQKQPVTHPNKSLLPHMQFFFQLASDYIIGKDKPCKVERQPFYHNLTSYQEYLEQKLKSTWVDVLHNFFTHLKVPLHQHREVIRFPSTCELPNSIGKMENIIVVTGEYSVIKTFRQLPLYSMVMLLPKESMPDASSELTFANLKSISTSNIRFAFVFPKLFHKCSECKDEKHLILRCDADFLDHGMADREVFVIPIMNNVEYLQQLQILRRSKQTHPLPCLTALSLGGSGMSKYHLHSFLGEFNAKKPVDNHVNYLLQKLIEVSFLPVTKATLVQTEAMLKLEQFRAKNKVVLGSLEKPLNSLIEKWKSTLREVEVSKVLPSPAVDALRRRSSSQLAVLSKLYDSIGKESLILQEVADLKSFKDLLPGIAVILAADRPVIPRRVLVCLRGTESVVDDLYASVGQISSSPTPLRIKRAKGDNYVIPLLTNPSNLTFQFTSIRNWAEYRMKNGADMEKDDTFYFDVVMMVDLDRNIYELDTLIPMSFRAKQLLIFSNEGSENRVHLYRVLSHVNRAPLEGNKLSSESEIVPSEEQKTSYEAPSTGSSKSNNSLFSVKKIEPSNPVRPESRLAIVGSKRTYDSSSSSSSVVAPRSSVVVNDGSGKRNKDVEASSRAAIPIREMQLDFQQPSSRGDFSSKDNRYDPRNNQYRKK